MNAKDIASLTRLQKIGYQNMTAAQKTEYRALNKARKAEKVAQSMTDNKSAYAPFLTPDVAPVIKSFLATCRATGGTKVGIATFYALSKAEKVAPVAKVAPVKVAPVKVARKSEKVAPVKIAPESGMSYAEKVALLKDVLGL